MAFPLQPIVRTEAGVIRFQQNKIVNFLLDWASERGMSLNELALMDFSIGDREQLAQLIGYSTDGYYDLPYLSDETYQRVEDAVGEFQMKEYQEKQEGPTAVREILDNAIHGDGHAIEMSREELEKLCTDVWDRAKRSKI
jgi:hypothetical protein